MPFIEPTLDVSDKKKQLVNYTLILYVPFILKIINNLYNSRNSKYKYNNLNKNRQVKYYVIYQVFGK